MCAALDDAGRRDEGELCLVTELREAERTTVAHRRADLGERRLHVLLQRPCIGDVGINPLLKGELLAPAEIIPLPVARAVRALAPIFLIVGAVHHDTVRRALIEA